MSLEIIDDSNDLYPVILNQPPRSAVERAIEDFEHLDSVKWSEVHARAVEYAHEEGWEH